MSLLSKIGLSVFVVAVFALIIVGTQLKNQSQEQNSTIVNHKATSETHRSTPEHKVDLKEREPKKRQPLEKATPPPAPQIEIEPDTNVPRPTEAETAPQSGTSTVQPSPSPDVSAETNATLSLFFPYDQETPGTKDREALHRFLAGAPKKDRSLSIKGYTDAAGSIPYNQTLSMERAHSVAQIVREKWGLPDYELNVTAFGEAKPLASNSNIKGRHRNRRVEVHIQTPDGATSKHTIHFSYKSTQPVTEEMSKLLGSLTDMSIKGLTISISGHSDAVGPRLYNLKLSHERAVRVAQAVQSALEHTGGYALEISAVGELYANAAPTEPESNRRVDLHLLNKHP